MEKLLRDTLAHFGLSNKEILFFIVNYKLGPATVNEIAHSAQLERSTAYLIAQNLIKKGYVLEDFKSYRRTMITLEPQDLLRKLAAKKRQIGRHELSLMDKLPDLQAAYQASSTRPRLRSYDGTNGLVSVWTDILATPQEVLLWTNQETEGSIFTQEHHELFVKERLKKEIPIRVLAIDNARGRKIQATDKDHMRQTRILPSAVYFSAETYIYGNRVAILDHKKNIMGIIIESEQIALAQRAIFEMSWNLQIPRKD